MSEYCPQKTCVRFLRSAETHCRFSAVSLTSSKRHCASFVIEGRMRMRTPKDMPLLPHAPPVLPNGMYAHQMLSISQFAACRVCMWTLCAARSKRETFRPRNSRPDGLEFPPWSCSNEPRKRRDHPDFRGVASKKFRRRQPTIDPGAFAVGGRGLHRVGAHGARTEQIPRWLNMSHILSACVGQGTRTHVPN